MTCQITIRSVDRAMGEMAIPLTAVLAPASGGNYVWIVEGGKVRRQAVELGNVFGHDMVSVRKGLDVGDVIVTAGIYRLQDGEQVRIINH